METGYGVTEEYVNELAVGWYFLSMYISVQQDMVSEVILDELKEDGLVLKTYMRSYGFTFLEPMTVIVDTETYFHMWIDADLDICASGLYSETDQ